MISLKKSIAILAVLLPFAAYPQEPIRLLIGAPPGGGTDALFRSLGRQAEAALKTAVVPVNLPAAGGSQPVEQVMRSAANGTTIAAVSNSTLTASPHIIRVPFKQDDFLPLLQVSSAPYVMCVSPAFPARTAQEFVAALRSAGDKYTVGTDPGIGQLAAGRILKGLNVQARIIPFKGASEIVVAFLGGHVDIYQGSIPVILPHVMAGKAHCLLLTSAERSARLPAASSLTDVGIPQEATTLTRVMVIHKGTPPQDVRRLQDAFEAVAQSEETRRLLDAAGDTYVIVKGEALRSALQAEFEAFGQVAKRLGIAP